MIPRWFHSKEVARRSHNSDVNNMNYIAKLYYFFRIPQRQNGQYIIIDMSSTSPNRNSISGPRFFSFIDLLTMAVLAYIHGMAQWKTKYANDQRSDCI